MDRHTPSNTRDRSITSACRDEFRQTFDLTAGGVHFDFYIIDIHAPTWGTRRIVTGTGTDVCCCNGRAYTIFLAVCGVCLITCCLLAWFQISFNSARVLSTATCRKSVYASNNFVYIENVFGTYIHGDIGSIGP